MSSLADPVPDDLPTSGQSEPTAPDDSARRENPISCSSSTKTSPESFDRFPDLPTEIRLLIWEMAIDVQFRNRDAFNLSYVYAIGDHTDFEWPNGGGPVGAHRTTPFYIIGYFEPSLLVVSRESRACVLKTWNDKISVYPLSPPLNRRGSMRDKVAKGNAVKPVRKVGTNLRKSVVCVLSGDAVTWARMGRCNFYNQALGARPRVEYTNLSDETKDEWRRLSPIIFVDSGKWKAIFPHLEALISRSSITRISR